MTQSAMKRPRKRPFATPSFCGPANNNSSASRTCFSRRASVWTLVGVMLWPLCAPRTLELSTFPAAFLIDHEPTFAFISQCQKLPLLPSSAIVIECCAQTKSKTTTAPPMVCRLRMTAASVPSPRQWMPVSPPSGWRQRSKRTYSSHLPLDEHPRLGNNAQLCAALGLKALHPFFYFQGQPIGFQAGASISRTELTRRLQRAVGEKPLVIPAGPRICRRVGVVTGGAGGDLKQAAAEGVDTFITGEGPHWTYAAAEELGLNIFYGGHYATETFGVKALAAHLSRRFKVPWTFLDHPTGL